MSITVKWSETDILHTELDKYIAMFLISVKKTNKKGEEEDYEAASLEGKMGKFALIKKDESPRPTPLEDFTEQVLEVLVKQLGHRFADAKQMIAVAQKRNPNISTPEELFEEVYRGQKP